MFVFEGESEVFWFNKDSFESELEFELIGILSLRLPYTYLIFCLGIMLGLAIYNSVILDVRFPLAVYKKLLNQPLKFKDMKGFNPALHKGLVQLLEFDG
jgi:ubiquitin-protein ligase E3 A